MTLFSFALWCLILSVAMAIAAILLDVAKSSPHVKPHSFAEIAAEHVTGPMVFCSGICGGLAVLAVPGGIISFFINN